MEQELLQLIGIFIGGLIGGVLLMLLINKLGSGNASASGLKQEYDDYQEKVETHFEETSKKFQQMTEQYQDLYTHLSLGATTLCRSDSVAATLADQSVEAVKLEKVEPAVDSSVSELDEELEKSVKGNAEGQAIEDVAVEQDAVNSEAPQTQVESDASDVKDETKSV